MNITLNIPAASFERLLSALERIANSADRFCPPVGEYKAPEPYTPDYWGTSSNAQSIQIEEEDNREALGYGSEYQARFDSVLGAANRLRNIADANRQGPTKDPGQS